jgi:hypothetical protein
MSQAWTITGLRVASKAIVVNFAQSIGWIAMKAIREVYW